MATRTFGPSKGNRRPSIAIPGSSGAGRPAAQKGGGGNKEAGSVEPTAANTPTVTISSTGAVTAEHFGPSPKAQARATREKQRAQQSKRRVGRIRTAVLKSTETKPVRAKAPQIPKGPKQAPGKPHIETVPSISGGTKAERAVIAAKVGVGPLKPGGKEIKGIKGARIPQKHPQAAKRVARQLKTLRAKTKGTGQLHTAIVTTPEQRHVVKTILRTAKKTGADRKEKLAALDTGLQESGLKNLPISGPGGGWRQEESAFYPASSITNVRKGAENYFSEAKAAGRGKGMTIPETSQAIQGSGAGEFYYKDNVGEAKQLLHQYNKDAPSPKLKAKLKAVEAKAENLGVPTHEKAPPKVVKKYKSAISAMSQINAKGYEYQWGGGHGGKAGEPVGGPGPGFDCSGAISAMLHSVGDLSKPLVSGDMGQALDPGPGAITVFYNGVHTFAYIPAKHEYWGTSESNPGGGAGYFAKSVGDSEVASGDSGGAFNVGHVPGLGKKQARQLGILNLGPGGGASSTSGGSFAPGMTISPSGTTATVNSGAGAHQEKPGFSKHPLTISQRVARTTKKLETLGVIKGEEPAPAGRPTMTALEKKYGAPVV